MKTFVFTDITGSTSLKGRMPGNNDNERAQAFVESILKPHVERLKAQLDVCEGRLVKSLGDGHLFVFDQPSNAANWAISVQMSHQQNLSGFEVSVKIGIHVGNAVEHPDDPNDFIGKPLDYAARLTERATGGQILVSQKVMALLSNESLDDISFFDHGEIYLAGIGDREVYEMLFHGKKPQDTKITSKVANADKDNFPTDDLEGFLAAGGKLPKLDPSSPLPSGSPSSPSTQQPPQYGLSSTRHHSSPMSDVRLADSIAGTDSNIASRLGQYELIELLGSGGMGDVYLAKHVGMGRRCAIKVIRRDLVQAGHAELVDRFYREIKAAGDLSHPNIVVAYDSSTPHDQVHYLVMEYVEGISLDKLIQQTGPLRVENAAELIHQAATGLQCLYDRKMVHRDIKPSNLMLAKDGSRAVVKILDMGLALLIDETEERITEFQHNPIGTGMFMAPEQWETTSVDIRADIYSLGCTMYHLLVGQPPFKTSKFTQKHAHQTERPPAIRRDTPIPKGLWAIQQRMLAKKPDDRFAIPAEVASALEEFRRESDLDQLLSVSINPADMLDSTEAKKWDTRSSNLPNLDTKPLPSKTQFGTSRFAFGTPWQRALDWSIHSWIARGLLVLLIAAAAATWLLLPDGPTSDDTLIMQATPAERNEAISFLATLPGLNGQWWYYEIPWFCPRVRMQVLHLISKGEFDTLKKLADADNEDEFYTRLLALSDRADQENSQGGKLGEEIASLNFNLVYKGLLGRLPNLLNRNPNPQTEYLIKELEAICHETNHPADYHLLAILQWRVSRDAVASQNFKKAINGYRSLPKDDEVAKLLLARCYADEAFTVLKPSPGSGNWSSPITNYEYSNKYSPNPAADLLHVFSLAMRAKALQQDSSSSDNELESAMHEAESKAIERTGHNHPMRAFLNEQIASISLESWQLKNAINRAREAAKIRSIRFESQNQLDRSSSKDHSRHARYMYMRDKQIEALAYHFSGKAKGRNSASGIFNDLLDRVDDYETDRKGMSDDELEVLLDMKPNLYGRLSDSRFYLLGDLQAALASLTMAREAAIDSSFQDDNRKKLFLIRFGYREVIIHALLGDQENAQQSLNRSNLLLDIDETSNEANSADAGNRFNRWFRTTAIRFLLQDKARTSHLVEMITKIYKSSRLRRDDLQLLLFVCEYLLQQKELTADDRMLVETFNQRLAKEMTPIDDHEDVDRYRKALRAAIHRMLSRPGSDQPGTAESLPKQPPSAPVTSASS